MDKPMPEHADPVIRHLYHAIAACEDGDEELAGQLMSHIQDRLRRRYSLQDMDAPTEFEVERRPGFRITVWRDPDPAPAPGAGNHEANLRGIANGSISPGPATTTMFFPILLPWCCCHQARARACARCGAAGWSHGAHAPGDLRCLDCQEYLDPAVADRLRQ